MKLIECVPNFSEGRRPEVVAAIRDAIAAVDGAHVLDVSSDASHNRTVITFVAPVETVADAAFAGIREAHARIDLREHRGEHPRIGATDVVPFVPLEGATMEDCVALARQLGERVGRELDIPVYLYERAATRPARENLADVRRGEFEALQTELGSNPAREPDFGPNRVHPTAGATAIGARPFLVAYNIYLGPATNLQVAKDVAKAIRGSSGGLRFVKALGLEVDGQAQVSMNLVDTEKTPLFRAYELVRSEAAAYGVAPTWSELVGLVPERVLLEAGARHVQLRAFHADQVLERRVRNAAQGGESLTSFVASVAAPVPTPGGGTVAAHAGGLAAALVQMVASLTVGKKKYAEVEGEMKEAGLQAAALVNELAALGPRDARSYEAVSAAYRMPKDNEAEIAARQAAIATALVAASEVPLYTARACTRAAELAAAVAERGNSNAVSDAGVAALIAQAACRGAVYNVRINVAALEDKSLGAELLRESTALVDLCAQHADRATQAVERALGT